jgi:hypothetical protein
MLTLAGGTAAILHLATASAGPPPPQYIDLMASTRRPVAGEVFRGLAVVNRSTHRISKLDCDADLAGNVLPGIKHYFVPRFAIDGSLQVVLCSWKIPRGSAGFQLLPDDADNVQYAGGYLGLGAVGTFSWTVKKR